MTRSRFWLNLVALVCCLSVVAWAAAGSATSPALATAADQADVGTATREAQQQEELADSSHDYAQPLQEEPLGDLVESHGEPQPPLPDACFIDEHFNPYWSPGSERHMTPDALLLALLDEARRLEHSPVLLPGARDPQAEAIRGRLKETARLRALHQARLVTHVDGYAGWLVTLDGRISAEFIAHDEGSVGWVLVHSRFQVPKAVCAIDAKGT